MKPGAVPATFAGSPKQNNSVLWASCTTFRFCQNRYSLVGHISAQQTIISSILDRCQSHAAVRSLTGLSLEAVVTSLSTPYFRLPWGGNFGHYFFGQLSLLQPGKIRQQLCPGLSPSHQCTRCPPCSRLSPLFTVPGAVVHFRRRCCTSIQTLRVLTSTSLQLLHMFPFRRACPAWQRSAGSPRAVPFPRSASPPTATSRASGSASGSRKVFLAADRPHDGVRPVLSTVVSRVAGRSALGPSASPHGERATGTGIPVLSAPLPAVSPPGERATAGVSFPPEERMSGSPGRGGGKLTPPSNLLKNDKKRKKRKKRTLPERVGGEREEGGREQTQTPY